MARGNPDKLKPVRSKQEASERGRKGGRASGAARREKKTLREALLLLMDAPQAGDEGQDTTTREAMAVAMVNKALSGDVKAFEVVRDTIGEKPVDKVDSNMSGGITLCWGGEHD